MSSFINLYLIPSTSWVDGHLPHKKANTGFHADGLLYAELERASITTLKLGVVY